jgi:hypothetical protein
MLEPTIAVALPVPLHQRLLRLAELTDRPLEALVIQALDANVPQLPDETPAAVQQDLADLETLPVEQLWQVAHSVISRTQQREYSKLLDKQRAGVLDPLEAEHLEILYQQANRHMVRKAYAAVLLQWRKPEPQ